MKDFKNKNLLGLFILIWKHIYFHRKVQFCFILLLIFITSFLEILSIGAVIPFLTILTDPNLIFNHSLLNKLFLQFGYIESYQIKFPVTLFFVITVLISNFFRIVLLWVQTKFAFKIGSDFSINIYRNILYLPYLTQIKFNSSEYISTISHKTVLVVTQALLPVLIIISSSLILISFLFIAFQFSPITTLKLIFVFGLIYLMITLFFKRRVISYGDDINVKTNFLIKLLQEGFGGVRDIIISSNQEAYCNAYRYSEIKLRTAQANLMIIGQTPRFIIEGIGISVLVLFAFFLSKSDNSINSVIPVIGIIALSAQRLLPIFQQIYASITSILGCKAILKEILRYLEANTKIDFINNSESLTFNKIIEFKNINFNYSKRVNIFNNFNLIIKKGSKVGIIGPTGCGKSTLIDLIMGLILPEKGKIFIDKTPLSKKNVSQWQENISHVPQNIFLTDSTIIENIAFGENIENIDIEKVIKMAKKACIHDDIINLPLKYNTLIGERGINLSGGQRQRIGIARALYREKNVIIFDEATSALDYKTEHKVVNNIFKTSPNVTLIMISHRISTLKRCNMIIDLKNNLIKKS